MTFEQLYGTRPDRSRVGAGTGQPDRRAHRLQRRLRPADRHPAADASWNSRRGRAAAFAPLSLNAGKPVPFEYIVGTESKRCALDRLPAGHHLGARQGGLQRGRRRHPHRIDGAARQRPLVERRARDRAAARLPRSVHAADRRRADGAARAARRERLRGRAGRHHGPDGVHARGRRPGAVPRHAVARLDASCRCRPTAELVVLNSGVAHNHAKGDYRTRRAECEEAARQLGVAAAARPRRCTTCRACMELPEPLGRRARHVVTEDARVLAAVAGHASGRPRGARPAVLRVPRLDARRLRGLDPGDRPDRRPRPGRCPRSTAPA